VDGTSFRGFGTKSRASDYDYPPVPNDRVCAFALWEGWFGYDRKKYAAMLHEAFEPFVLCVPKRAEPVLLSDSIFENDLKRFPLFSGFAISRPESGLPTDLLHSVAVTSESRLAGAAKTLKSALSSDR